ncbi:MAG TPA: hypothetical protein DD417_10565 [Elusimicrobia bacterium]|nr:MAG: hypothetical protein A2X37_01435 [Elusimicrobia bacterium GWA2_66_18]OGR77762.1 MAG: hypothetical protein A2X40_07745 [Elusimicrobia bacterium GWC2_65_9]HBL17162.1 hypothetical protein [Elusimicrobiota bacterium]
MNGFWTDGWFYISSVGLLVSGVLFFVLLGQYRAAAEAADRGEPAAEPETPPSPVQPLYVEETAAAARVVSAPLKTPKDQMPAPESSDVISPSVVYLQNLQTIKTQLEGLHGEILELSKRVDAVSGRDAALIERLSDIARAVEGLKSAAAAGATAAPKRARKFVPEKAPEPAPAPVPVENPAPVAELKIELGPAPGPSSKKPAAAPQSEPAPEPKPASSADETMRLDLTAAIESQLAKKPAPTIEPVSPPPQDTDASGSEKPARRGPVWPV